MTNYRTKRFVLSLLLAAVGATSQAQNRLATLEYWIDANYASRQTVSTDGNFAKEIDVSSLCNGVHTITMRVSDAEGRWSGTLLRHFLKTSSTIAENELAKYEYWIDSDYKNTTSGQLTGTLDLDIDVSNLCQGVHTLQLNIADKRGQVSQTMFRHFLKLAENVSDRKLAHYEYWIDTDYANVQSGATADGNITLDIDVSSLCKGVHTLSYQVQDDEGHKSAPRLIHFLIPDVESGVGTIAAYEYWFNHGPRTRVELQPASPTMSINDMIIEIKGVVPNTVEGYRFYAAEERAEVDDNVFFGMQVYNADNQGSLAVQSDEFPMTVPVELNMKALTAAGEPLTVAAPASGRMQGMKSETAIGDSLIYTLSLENVKADFYDAAGNQLEAVRKVTEAGEATYTLMATSAYTYMLVYGASEIQTELTATLLSLNPAGVGSIWSDDAKEVNRYNTGGQAVSSRQRGINIVRMSDGTVRKVIIK